ARFHVPGHKGGLGADDALVEVLGEAALAHDLAQGVDGIDDGPEPTPYTQAERLAAEAYGAEKSWFLTNGASQGNHALCLALAPLGRRVVAQRNSHASIVDGLVLSGGNPIFIEPEYDSELGMALGVEPTKLAALLAENPDVRTAFIVSPTYYGLAADVAGCAEVAHAAGVALVVDQSWGAHLGFHPDLPPSALALGADAVLTSTHKLGGSMTQSAMLHLGSGGRIDEAAVGRAVRILRSTSQSTLLISSLDAARRQLATRGEELLGETLEKLVVVRERLEAIDGIELVDESFVGRAGVAGFDPLRIVLDVRAVGCSGLQFLEHLSTHHDVHPEMAAQATVVFVVSLAETDEQFERLVAGVEATAAELSCGFVAVEPVPRLGVSAGCVVPPREAFLGEAEVVALDQAVGRISCESIAGYPPGIPALLPGERVSAEVIDNLRQTAAAGSRLHGASDPTLSTIAVLLEERPD
ncbi:MAG: amino acid decarboxylase, partial [Solirubrobacteraceae bacterium]|nr:amino acid decarboxylase [Solirubrobacteraceae bacterium]